MESQLVLVIATGLGYNVYRDNVQLYSILDQILTTLTGLQRLQTGFPILVSNLVRREHFSLVWREVWQPFHTQKLEGLVFVRPSILNGAQIEQRR